MTDRDDVIRLAEHAGMNETERRNLHALQEMARELHNVRVSLSTLHEQGQNESNLATRRHQELKQVLQSSADRTREAYETIVEVRGDIRQLYETVDDLRARILRDDAFAAAVGPGFPAEEQTRRHGFPRPPTPMGGFVPMAMSAPEKTMTSDRAREVAGEVLETRVGRASISLLMLVLGAIASGVGGAILHALMSAH